MQYVVCGELTKMQYEQLLKFALTYSHAFGVSSFRTRKKDLSTTYFTFFQEMAPYAKDLYQYSLPQHYERGQKFWIYELNALGKKYLCRCESFWDWALPELPEDLSFFRHKKIWLNCITHEKMIIVISEDPNLLSFIEGLGIKMRVL